MTNTTATWTARPTAAGTMLVNEGCLKALASENLERELAHRRDRAADARRLLDAALDAAADAEAAFVEATYQLDMTEAQARRNGYNDPAYHAAVAAAWEKYDRGMMNVRYARAAI